MNPEFETAIRDLSVPNPPAEAGGSFSYKSNERSKVPEQGTKPVELPNPSGSPTSSKPVPTTLTAAQPVEPPAMPSAMIQNATPATTDDSSRDQLDEEWIQKAKAIVEKTHADPYIESHEISRVKADYLKTRYNKHIKTVEDQGQ